MSAQIIQFPEQRREVPQTCNSTSRRMSDDEARRINLYFGIRNAHRSWTQEQIDERFALMVKVEGLTAKRYRELIEAT